MVLNDEVSNSINDLCNNLSVTNKYNYRMLDEICTGSYIKRSQAIFSFSGGRRFPIIVSVQEYGTNCTRKAPKRGDLMISFKIEPYSGYLDWYVRSCG